MTTVTIPKTKYEELKKKAETYELIFSLLNKELFVPPPVKSAAKIMKELKKAGTYSSAFLESVKKGFKRSSYFTK